MATKNCQNDPVLLYIAKEVGRKVYTMGLEIDYNRDWYTPIERDAFEVGWLEAANESSFKPLPAKFIHVGLTPS
jgi:hypothetical protein